MSIYLYLFLSAIGFLDAAFLTIQHFTRDPFACPIFGGCDEVTSSIYSQVFGIPIALFGALYYGVIFALTLYCYLKSNRKLFLTISHLSILGLITSIYLVTVMVFVLNSLCFYCLVSATSSTLLFVIFIVNWLTWKRPRSQSESEKS